METFVASVTTVSKSILYGESSACMSRCRLQQETITTIIVS